MSLRALAVAAVGLADRGDVVSIASITGGDGAANHVFRARTREHALIVKARVDSTDDAAREAVMLRALPKGPWPTLHAHTHARALRATAAQHDVSSLRALEGDCGGIIVLSALVGRAIATAPENVGDDDVAKTAQAIAALHFARASARNISTIAKAKRAGSLPRTRMPNSPAGLIGVARELCVFDHDAQLTRVLQQATRKAARHAEERHPNTRVRAICHGDLRFHNVLTDGDSAALIDFEFAGIGDPMVDLAFMASRTPLSRHQELVLLDAYFASSSASSSMSRARINDALARYFAVRPLCAIIGGAAGAHDLTNVAVGARAIAEDVSAYVQRRVSACRTELADVVGDAIARAFTIAPRQPKRANKHKRIGKIAIDGTAASGKSVVARAIASRYGVPHINTGAAYRFFALLALEHGARIADAADIIARFNRAKVSLDDEGSLRVGGARLDEVLGVFEVDDVVSRFAALPAVRAAVNAIVDRDVAAIRDGVVEGRDITSRVWPKAPHRWCMTATVQERARRVHARVGRVMTLARVVRMLEARDRIDVSRAHDPLIVTSSVWRIDTTRASERAVVERCLARIEGER